MDLKTLQEILPDVPVDATEIVIKGRDATEVFFSMPKGWKPNGDTGHRIIVAPNPTYYSKSGGSRWRVK